MENCGEWIILADDKEDIRSTIKKIQEICDDNVHTFLDDRQALEAFSQSPGRYDLMIRVLSMPKSMGSLK